MRFLKEMKIVAFAYFLLSAGSVYASPCGSGLDTGNVDLTNSSNTMVQSNNCYGKFNTPANGLTGMKTFANNNNLFGGNNWSGVVQDAPDLFSQSSYGSYGGFTFALNAGDTGILSSDGSYTLSVIDTNGAALPNLPVVLDLAVILTRSDNGDNSAAYFFNDISLDSNNPGYYNIVFDPKFLDSNFLDKITILAKPADPSPSKVPEPANLALFGIGLLGLASRRRRRQ